MASFHTLGYALSLRRHATWLADIGRTNIAGALLLSGQFLRDEKIERYEYPLLMLFSALGMCMMVSANSFLAMYMAIELQSLPIYVLAAVHRDDLRSTEAGLKYFILGALASGMLLYGSSLIYGFTGTVGFVDFGCAKVLPEGQRRRIVNLMRCAVEGRRGDLRSNMVESGFFAADSVLTADDAYRWWEGIIYEILAPQPVTYTDEASRRDTSLIQELNTGTVFILRPGDKGVVEGTEKTKLLVRFQGGPLWVWRSDVAS